MKLKLATLFSIVFLSTSAQNNVIDSLKLLLKTPISDSTKVKVLGDLSWYYSGISTDSAFYFGNAALDLSKKTKNLNGEAQAYNDFGIIHYKLSNFDTSISFYKKALLIRIKNKDSSGVGSLYNKMGISYQRIFKMDSAIYFNTKALEIFEKLKNIQYVALIKNNIANIYFNLKQYEKALTEHLEVAEIRTRINDEYGLVYSYTNIGNSYLYLKDTLQSLTYYKKGIEVSEKNNYEQELSALYNNYGGVLKDQNKYGEALKMFDKSLKLRKKLNDSYGISSVALNMGDLYLQTGKINNAELKFREALYLANKTNANELKMNSYKSLLYLFAHKNNSDSVIHYQKLYSVMQDSMFNSRVTKEIAEIQEKYDTAQREKEISQQKEQILKSELEIKNKNLYALLLGSGLLVFSIISFGLYKRQQHKKREYLNQLQLKEAQTYSKLQDQRLRISRDLHDNIGSQLTFIISSIDNLKFLTDATNVKLKNKLAEINQFASATIGQLRDTIWAMNKNEISYQDLQSRLLAFIEKVKTVATTIQFHFTSNIQSSNIVFSSIKGINIFRVFQETLNNAIKYSEATEINICISENSEHIEFEIADNGKGFDINTTELGNGLENMQHRIKEIGGEIIISSTPAKGTLIKISCFKNKTNAL
ncbi:tetratricopeptide repeat-containing sensor histidine kinase [uncultured Lutibacter sp.]|uniref:tetratricopeptide repeat-containing sensor histidine kinase n=1 Tax=uncultured Lutibacter sp. TaxID=437739 RepID=UPI002639E40C|nr:tetratricopeptide repeat-containing sensor histidine kinase [uncultured Lutibacter sp.]